MLYIMLPVESIIKLRMKKYSLKFAAELLVYSFTASEMYMKVQVFRDVILSVLVSKQAGFLDT
jgi:hypothetical protein